MSDFKSFKIVIDGRLITVDPTNQQVVFHDGDADEERHVAMQVAAGSAQGEFFEDFEDDYDDAVDW